MPNHTIPVTPPTIIPFRGLSNKCNFTVFFSINQKTYVKTKIANKGGISAHNLHIAGFSEDDNGKIADKMTQPRKNPTNF